MRVLVNAISAKMGGIVTYTTNLIESLKARGVDVVVAVPREFEYTDKTSIMPTSASNYGAVRRFIWEQTKWRSIVNKIKPDVLFSSANFGLFASSAPQVLLLREGGLFDPFYLANLAPDQDVRPALSRAVRRRLMIASASQADYVMTPTEAMRDLLIKWAPDLSSRCAVNPYGTLSDAFKPVAKRRKWRGDGCLRLLYVSVYYPHKNPGIISETVGHLEECGVKTHATITMTLEEVFGTRGGDVDYRLLKMGEALGRVTLGRHDYHGLPKLYGAHDIFVFPSVSETFGHPMAEAMSSGLPVIAADTAVNREVCGDAALYFSPFSRSDLESKIRHLDEDPDLREKMAIAGRKRALAMFKWDDHVDRLVEIFENVRRRR